MRSHTSLVTPAAALLAVALLLPSAAHAALDSAATAAVGQAKAALQAAMDDGDYAAAVAARARFAALAAADPGEALLHYWVAVADWRAASLQMQPHLRVKKQIKAHCKAGLAAADRALQLDPRSAEAIAVKLGLQGLSISVGGPLAGMTLGPKMEGEIKRALELAPDNPRVLYSEGMNLLHKPAFVGGSAEKALARFRLAIEKFAAERVSDAAAPDWGLEDAHMWAGQAAMKLDDPAAARAHYEKALEINPNSGWTRTTLLPAAERALAKTSARGGS